MFNLNGVHFSGVFCMLTSFGIIYMHIDSSYILYKSKNIFTVDLLLCPCKFPFASMRNITGLFKGINF